MDDFNLQFSKLFFIIFRAVFNQRDFGPGYLWYYSNPLGSDNFCSSSSLLKSVSFNKYYDNFINTKTNIILTFQFSPAHLKKIERNLWKAPLSICPVGQVNRSLSGLQILATSEATFYQIFGESQLRGGQGGRGAWRLRGGGRGAVCCLRLVTLIISHR